MARIDLDQRDEGSGISESSQTMPPASEWIRTWLRRHPLPVAIVIGVLAGAGVIAARDASVAAPVEPAPAAQVVVVDSAAGLALPDWQPYCAWTTIRRTADGAWAVPAVLAVPDQESGTDTVLSVRLQDGSRWTVELSFGTAQLLARHRVNDADRGVLVFAEPFDLQQVWGRWVVLSLVADTSGDSVTAAMMSITGRVLAHGTGAVPGGARADISQVQLTGHGCQIPAGSLSINVG